MKKLLGVGLSVLVNALMFGVLAWSSLLRPPDGEVQITDLTGGTSIVLASREH